MPKNKDSVCHYRRSTGAILRYLAELKRKHPGQVFQVAQHPYRFGYSIRVASVRWHGQPGWAYVASRPRNFDKTLPPLAKPEHG